MQVDGGRLVRRFARVAHANAHRAWTEREGVVLELRSGDLIGVGEASPLPGYSSDDLTTCIAELERCWARLPPLDVAAPVRETLRAAVRHAGVHAPAAVFALEAALLDLVSTARHCPAWVALRGDEGAAPIPLSALAEGATPEALADAADRARARGIRVVKIKIGGPEGLTRDPPRLAAVRARVGGAVAMRLDANQTLSAERLVEALDAYAAFGPELLEEPALPEALSALRASPIPLALDESLMNEGWQARLEAARATGGLRAVVLKPMTLGGFERCLSIAEAAHAAGLAVIVTHVFDGPIGSAAAACLALAVRGETLPCGLDAHGRLEHPIAALDQTHILPFKAHGLGVDAVTYDETKAP